MARNSGWLEENAKLIEARRREGTLGDEQFAAFESIIAKGRQGQWDEAQSEVMRLSKAQRPTTEEVEQLKANKTTGKKQ